MEQNEGQTQSSTDRVGYISVKPELAYAQALNRMLKVVGIEDSVPPEEMHVTLMYDESNSVSYEATRYLRNHGERNYYAEITELELINGEHLVIHLDSYELTQRHEELSVLFSHSYPQFLPHMTVKYDATEKDLEVLRSVFPLIKSQYGSIMLSNETFKEAEQ